jgi:hypothetical protein
MPPSPKVMPHDTFGDAARNLLALRCAPRSSWLERAPLRRLALLLDCNNAYNVFALR